MKTARVFGPVAPDLAPITDPHERGGELAINPWSARPRLAPPARGLAVRLVAGEADRIARIRRRRGLDEATARHWMHEADRARQSFIRHHFHFDPADPLGYDLTINTSRVGVDGAARLVVAGLTARGLLRPEAGG